ncbi:CHAT domain-containing protein [Nodosilinea sp. PGN35]|uniref:CHAT domain-containing protein n=1 Tax=Nodosilinea sp. PGN35 TaxID=3020489 RepID=UPI0023B28A2E|nr:CHAT domain-containing protein [Nodosilinea sp. TSF1-S3]MDF0365109.1 CHAT domain-containing protein [Nodosilinea sp. TSF1-S3]
MTRFLYAGLALGISGLWASPVLAQAILPSSDGTGTQVILNGSQFDIYGGALSADQLNLFHSFQQFGLSEGQIANFLANPALRNIVTQVVGGDPSVINGLLQVTGGNPNFYLMNPSGIVFGANAQLNLPASFAATTATGMQFGDRWLQAAGSNDYSALLGDPTAFGFGNAVSGAIVNGGNLAVGTGSTLSLLGGTVINTGQLTAPAGQILITAVPGESTVRLALPGYILALELDAPVVEGDQPQTWQLPITALPELLTTGLSSASLGLAVSEGGAVQLANGTAVPNYPGTTIVSGRVDVSGEQGGTAAVLGDRIGLVGAQIDASGTNDDGGQILVGGEFQGNGPLPNAQRTYVDANTTLNADAGPTGNGGRIIIWADEATGFYGNLTARGGQLSGDGGFAEVSGRDYLQFDGTADLSSSTGENGTLLLDPINITISNTNESPVGVRDFLGETCVSRFVCSILDGTFGNQTDFPGQSVTINQDTLRGLDGNVNLVLQASENIIIGPLDNGTDQNGTALPLLLFAQGNGNINLLAGGDFQMSPNAAIIASSGVPIQGLNSERTLLIQATNITLGDISTRGGPLPGGNVVLRASGNIQTGDIATFADFDNTGATINPYNAGSITISGIPGINNGLPNTIDTSRGHLAAGAAQGGGNDIFLHARGDISTAFIGASTVASGNVTRGGNVTIISESGNIIANNNAPSITNPTVIVGAQIITGGNANFGGNIRLEAPNGRITIPGVGSGAENSGGSISITANEIEIRRDPVLNEPAVQLAVSSAPSQGSVSGSINLNGNIVIGNDVSLTTSSSNAAEAGDIVVNGSINSRSASIYNLTINSGQGTAQVNGSIGTINPIGNLTVDSQQTILVSSVRTADRPVTFNSPVLLNSTSQLTFNSGTASISLNGLNAGNTPLSLIANDTNLSGTLQGNSTLTIQPSILSRGITLGNADTNTLNLSPTELSALQGFSTVTIGGGSGDITVNAPVTFNTSTQLTTAGNITSTGDINSNSGNIALSGNTVNTNAITTNGSINVTGAGAVSVTNITSNGGNIALSAQQGRLSVNNATSNGGSIGLSSTVDGITVNTLSSASGTGAGGNITISNPNAITATGPINASGATTGGNITLSAGGSNPTGTVTTNNLTATGVANGGNITALARDSITAGAINTSASAGRGGNVFLDPFGDVEVSFINAQGGFAGTGGDVTIESIDRFFRATGAFTDQNGILASISAAGGGGEGTITITHNGGAADVLVPFTISTASQNGTAGALTTGPNAISTLSFRSFLGPFTQNNIRIITRPQATLAADAALPDTLPEEVQPADTDNRPFWLDEYFTRRTEDFLGLGSETPVKSLEQIQDDLRRVEELTGVKPALIYVVFEPEEVLRTIAEEGRFNPEDMINQGSLIRFREQASDSLELILVTSEGQPILRRPDDRTATRQVVPDLVNTFRTNLLFDFRTGDYQSETYLQEAQTLYEWLVKPLENDLSEQGISNLVFIMDAGLRSTPLATLSAMHNGNEYIIENYSVGLMPSFSLTDIRYTDIRDSRILAMGLSNFEEYPEFRNLPGVVDEIRIISQEIWPSSQNDLNDFLDSGFTPENLLAQRQANPVNIIHLATHTKFDSGSPENSFIQFFNEQISFNELRTLGFNNPTVNLLVLSACTTALTPDDESAELGFAGIAVQSGAQSSLASLWKVNDIGTLGLMLEFYSQLQNSVIKAEALRQAQLSMLREEVFIQEGTIHWTGGDSVLSFSMPNGVLSHPAYWAAFTIVGSPW